MKHVVLGTAGHIDHGKTQLTRVLTGVDTDRLPAEKKRGITIEPGFAPLKLSDDVQVSIVDVPGHERFIKNMMAGASGVDGALLTIACDDGVMPQTREHLNILQLLAVKKGIMVLTKSDLASAERIEEVKEQVRDLTKGTPFENAPVCTVSAVTGEGIEILKQQISLLVKDLREKDREKPVRLPVDRAFPVSGFGTVVTGTQTEGTLHVGDRVQIYPEGYLGNVRTLQHHNKKQETADAGGRTAISFTGLTERMAPERGDTVAEPDSMITAKILDVRLRINGDAPYKIRNSSQLHFFHGTREIVCRLRLLEADVLNAGGRGYAQLFLQEPISFRIGDPFILRFFSPVLTIGGGVILQGNTVRLRRNQQSIHERFANLDQPGTETALEQVVMDAGLAGTDTETLRKTLNCSQEEYASILSPLLEKGLLCRIGKNGIISRKVLNGELSLVVKWLQIYQKKYPLQPGMKIAELRGRMEKGAALSADTVLALFCADGFLKMENGYVSTPEFEPVFTQEHKIMQRKLLHYYKDAWFLAPDQKLVDEKFASRGIVYTQVLPNMKLTGKLVSLTGRYSVHFEAYEAALQLLTAVCERDGCVTIASFRDAAGISRKFSQLYLEYWDKQGITGRRGDTHILLRSQEKLTDRQTQENR